MSQCVPSWDVDDSPTSLDTRFSFVSPTLSSSAPDVAMCDFGVTELTWKNGQLAFQGLAPQRVPVNKPTVSAAAPAKYVWQKLQDGGTLESIVNQAARVPVDERTDYGDDSQKPVVNQEGILPWFEQHQRALASRLAMDALVPSRKENAAGGAPLMGCSPGVGSSRERLQAETLAAGAAAAQALLGPEWSSANISGKLAPRDLGQRVTFNTCDLEVGMGFASTSMGSPENTSSAKPCTKSTTLDDHDSACHSKPILQQEVAIVDDEKKAARKSSVSTKRSRAAAKRRDKINQRMKTLQRLVPNCSKTDKASMLDEVIEYLKQLQAQVHLMGRMNMPHMMLPMAIQQQLQMSMMAPMSIPGLGMGMGGLGVDVNGTPRNSSLAPGISPVMPNPFMQIPQWDGPGDARSQTAVPNNNVIPDPVVALLACQPPPFNVDAYSRIAALYQQLQQPPPSGSKT